jgi:hypothetical protein
MTELKPIHNSYLKLLLQEQNLFSILNSIDIDTIEDGRTKIICRTIKYSMECLTEYLNSSDSDEAVKLPPDDAPLGAQS